MRECIKKKYLLNGEVLNSKNFKNKDIRKEISVYEVIRIIDGTPLFLEDHYNRLNESLSILKLESNITIENLKNSIHTLINVNNTIIGNCKIVINKFKNTVNYYCYYIAHQYPTKHDYDTGINLASFKGIRSNPNAKVILYSLREKIDKKRKKNKIPEVVLINNENEITEGSRSNVFFIKENKVYSPPKHQILQGITKVKVEEICKEQNIPFIEKPISIFEIQQFEAAFISGTSPKILPVNKIDDVNFTVISLVLENLMVEYEKKITEYLAKYKI